MCSWARILPGSTRKIPSVIHAIEAHHGDVEPKTVIAVPGSGR